MLRITESANDRPIITRLKKSLMAKFRPNSENDLILAIRLAHYLLEVDETIQARELLESFLYYQVSDREEKFEHLWYWNSYGIMLLAFLERSENNPDRFEELIKVVEDSQYFQTDDPEHYYDELTDEHEDYDYHIEEYVSETHKYRCQILSQLFISYLFFEVMGELALGSDRSKMKGQLELVNKRINHVRKLLKEELLNKK